MGPEALGRAVGRLVLPADGSALVMGVLNVTPDSFSDGGVAYDPSGHPARAVELGRRLAAAGADIVDVGGESTRPGSAPVPLEVELDRVVPVVEALAADGLVVSVDTTKAAVARAAVEAGAAVVNDVSAGRIDPPLLDVVAASDVTYVLMHMRGTPATMQDDPVYDDVVTEVRDALAADLARIAARGVARERVVVDPGIGFGKTVAHNLALLARLDELVALGPPVLVGVSRKSFLGAVTGIGDPAARAVPSVAAALEAVRRGARIVRVHDVADTVAALAVVRAIEAAGRRVTEAVR